ncbi:helix-turn-helix domain-containing protein [Nocardia brasiliensis]|uniref:XRE family transcriptional regulator n=1 Tax=Nocardia brasiliensis (strain ATCC 700358 / HUJEG-1) TaxID=1133849 RepID=K0F490_NOCB7|nr:helix-turn-helix transcriptional regulator [Nocardia brasiliensis]AFU04374.1 XRE family transcriptional regulator [Nocardia brasiliensis ATCC 700358]OCF91611.1 DNA-binding protein [Nocardia brasiliensis]
MTTGSTLPRRLLARELRRARLEACVTAEVARNEIGVSKQTFWRMENGVQIRLNPLYIKRLCEIYELPPSLTRMLLGLMEETQNKAWWHAYDDALPSHGGLFVGLEDAAQHIISYQPMLLPSLVQTADYRRAMTWALHPNWPTADIEKNVEVMARRQSRLTDSANPLAFDAFIDEAALRRVTGSIRVMSDQLTRLADLARLPNVSVQVLPRTAGAYQGLLVGSFVLLEFPPHPTAYLSEPPVVYVQGFTGDLYLEHPEEIATYRAVCTDLKRLALPETDSRAYILDIAAELSE